ncbi:hypothetical protein ACU61A_15735 [Pseudonocardia sichuanensis]
MSAVAEAAAALEAALKTVEGLRVYTDPAATVNPPGVVVVPPTLTWGGYRDGPTDALFVVAVVVRPDARAVERLWELVPRVAAALDELPDVAVRQAEPGTWGSSNLPAYLIETGVALS